MEEKAFLQCMTYFTARKEIEDKLVKIRKANSAGCWITAHQMEVEIDASTVEVIIQHLESQIKLINEELEKNGVTVASNKAEWM